MPDSATHRNANELAALVERHTRADGTHDTVLPNLTLMRVSARAEPTHIVQEPALCVIAQGSKRVMLGDEALVYDAGRFLLASLDLPVAGEVLDCDAGRPYLALRLAIKPTLVAEFAEGGAPAAPTGLGMSVSPLDDGMLDALVRLLRLLDDPAHLPALAPLVEREILVRLLVGPQGARLREIALGAGGSHRVAQAVEILRRDFALPLRVEAIAREVGMSPSGLHHHFKTVTAMSPVQFQKRLRLQEARRLMLGEGLDAASAAFRVGYESPSQFSREYRRLFGAPPVQDVSRLRAAAAPA